MILQKALKLLVATCIIYCPSAKAQTTYGSVTISSPTGAALGKYGDIPVNYNTGIPQIDIPIYTIKEGPLSLPISLSYHASGLKVMEPSSWVGAGWSLNAGGVITRTVIGGPDERNTSAVENDGFFSDYGYHNYLYLNGTEDWQGFAAGRKDGEPDLFFFNFAGYSGKFYFRDDHTPVLVPQQDLKIEYTFPAGNGGSFSQQGYNIQAFTITTPNGDKYYFGNSYGLAATPPIEVTNAFSDKTGLSGGSVISSWYLNKIESADKQFAINLTYQTENYGHFTTAMYPIDGTYSQGSPYEYNLVKNIINGVRLNQINFSNGYVKFVGGAVRTDLSDASLSYLSDPTNQTATSLGSIQIFDNGIGYKNYKFYYSYFNDNTSLLTGYYNTSNYNSFMQADRKRLKLDSLQEVSADGTINLPPYKFSYCPGVVPRRLSFGIDHWGFINGITNNQTLIPTYTTTNGSTVTTVAGADRDANSAMLNGSLQQITYPTGGYTKFDFEPNDTYITYSQNQFQYLTSETIGYDGSNTPETATANSNTNPYEVNTSNNSAYDAQAVIKNSSGSVINTFSILANSGNQTTTYTFPSAGTYTIILSFTWGSNAHPATGTGAQINFRQSVLVPISQNVLVGGLRIKTITHHDGVSSNNNMITSYSYADNSGNSRGILYSRPVYVQQIRNDLVQSVGYWTVNGFQSNSLNPTGCPVLGLYVKSGGTIRPMETTQGYHIGYSSVKVSQTGNGYSIYNYYINSTGFALPPNSDVCVRTVNTAATCDPNTPNYPPAPLPPDYKRGELYYEQHYDNSGKLLKDVYYYPQYDTTFFMTAPCFIVAPRTNPGGYQMLLGTKYNLSTYRKTKTMVVETNYSQTTGSLTKTITTYFGSSYHFQPTRSVVTTSTTDSLVSIFKYTNDFRVAACDAVPDCSSSYNSSCSTCLFTYNSARTQCAGSSPCLSTVYLNYLECLTDARVNYVGCRRTNFTDSVNAFKTAHESARNSADGKLKPILQLQDEFINTPIEVNQWRNTNLLQSKFTNYDFAASPSAFVYPSKDQSINLATPSTTFAAATVSNNTVSKDSRYEDENFYTFNGGNPVQVRGRDGVSKSYLWGYQNKFPIAMTLNAASNEIYFSSFEEGGWNANMQYDNVFSHCGSYSGKIIKTTTGELYSHSNTWLNISLTATQKYHYSGWVYSNGPSVQIYLFMKRANETGYYSYIDNIMTTVTNKWVYLEKDFDVPADVTQLNIRVDNNGGGTVWFDDTRLYPSDAQMTTYTYDPVKGMTSQTDINNHSTYYEYDALGRLSVVRDQDKNVIKKICYNYSGQISNCSVSGPVFLTLTNVSGTSGFVATYTNVASNAQTTFNVPASGSTTVSLSPGTYNLLVNRASGNSNYLYSACSMNANSGTAIQNVTIRETSCNALTVDSIF